MKIRLLLYSIISTFLFIASVYNVKINELLLRYVIIFIFYSVSFYFAQKKFKQNSWLTFFCILLPPVLIDSSVLITNYRLAPLRFPYASIYPIAGTLSGLFFFQKSWVKLIGLGFLTACFIIVSYTVLLPGIIYWMEKRNEQLAKINTSFLYKSIFTVDKREISLNDTIKKKATMLELYFVKCPPCKMKLAAIKELYTQLQSKDFQVFFICDGSLTDYNAFQNNAKENNCDGFSFFYDSKNSICDSIVHGNGYPLEILLNKTNVHSFHYGFSEYSKKPYIKDELSEIKNILNEN